MARNVRFEERVQVRPMGLLRDLRAVVANIDNIADVEELVALGLQARSLRGELENRHIPVGDWLTDAIRRIDRAIDEATRDQRELELKQLRAEQMTDETATERRARRATRIAELEAQGVGK